MNSHKNARLTFEGRKLLIERISVMGLIPAAEAAGISLRTARKWRDRFDEFGVTSRRNPATRCRHIQATWRGAKRDLKASCGSGYFAAWTGPFTGPFLDAGATFGSRYDGPSSSMQ